MHGIQVLVSLEGRKLLSPLPSLMPHENRHERTTQSGRREVSSRGTGRLIFFV